MNLSSYFCYTIFMTEKLISELSLFLPCYNEEKNIQNTFDQVLPIIKEITDKWEIIIVNDGSKDDTGKIAKKISTLYPKNVSVVTHPINRGYGAAFKSGLYSAKYDWIALTDADGQFDFNDIKILIAAQKKSKADLAIGYYLGRKVPFYRILGSKLWQFGVFVLFGLWVTDTDCGFKLINHRVVDSIPKLEAERGPFITSEFLIKAKKGGFKMVEAGVHHYPRVFGEATGTKLNVILSGFKDLFRLWFKLNLKINV